MKQKIWFCLILFLIMFLSGCANPEEEFTKALEENRAKWESHHFTHYQWTLGIAGYDSTEVLTRAPLTIEVVEDKPISIVDVNGKAVESDDPDFIGYFTYEPEIFTISGLFKLIEKYYLSKPPAMSVTYDPDLGYPTEIYLDPYKEPCCQDITYTITDFKSLEP